MWRKLPRCHGCRWYSSSSTTATSSQGGQSLVGRVALVTGSTSGIGLGIAEAMAANGAHVMLNGFGTAEQIASLQTDFQARFGVPVAHHAADMSRPADIADLVLQTKKRFGAVDILVNNAGIQFTSRVEDFPDERWNAILAVNLSSCFHTIKHALPIMRQQRYGRIINVASVHGLVASKEKAAYVAAKHGVVGLTKVVALENAASHVTCNAICPGWVETPLVRAQIEKRSNAEHIAFEEAKRQLLSEKQPSLRFVSVEQLAQLAVFLCSDAASGMTGAAIPMDGGWTSV